MFLSQLNTQRNSPNSAATGMTIPVWLVWVVSMLCVWVGLGSYGVLNNNEGLYAQIPHEMLASGDIKHWIIPHLNGLPYM